MVGVATAAAGKSAASWTACPGTPSRQHGASRHNGV